MAVFYIDISNNSINPKYVRYKIKSNLAVTATLGYQVGLHIDGTDSSYTVNPLNAELNPICYLLALLAHHFLHVSRIRVKSLTFMLPMSYIYIYIYIYIYGAPILDVSRSHTTHHSR